MPSPALLNAPAYALAAGRENRVIARPPQLARPEGHAPTLAQLRAEAASCTRCRLYERATQTVFGEGRGAAPLMLVGEQAGDREDRLGRPFVGPAGHLLQAALEEAGIDRSQVYLTNAVKHFKWRPDPRSRRRLHSRPSASEIDACRHWLGWEIRLLRPRTIVCLGAIAVRGVLGVTTPLRQLRGTVLELEGTRVLVSLHPAAVLRLPDEEARSIAFAELVEDLRLAAGTET